MFPVKFRSWNKKFNQMEYQGDPDLETLESFMHHYGDSKYLMISTGVVDKNNNTVFEGDFLGGVYENCIVEWCKVCKQFQVFMIYEDKRSIECLSCLGEINWKEFADDENKDEIEVIGNIYQGVTI